MPEEEQTKSLDFYLTQLNHHLEGPSLFRSALQVQFELATLDFLRYQLCGTWLVGSLEDYNLVCRAERLLRIIDDGKVLSKDEYNRALLAYCSRCESVCAA